MTKLQELRLEKKLSQSELSKLSGVNFRTLQDFDQGRKSLSNAKGEMLYRLSYALDCSINDLLSDCVADIDFEYNDKTAFKNRMNAYARNMTLPDKSWYGKDFSFPILIDHNRIAMSRIYPTKQQLAISLHDALTPINDIVSVMLFGSSVTMRCTYESDTDLAIRLKEDSISDSLRNDVSGIVQELCDYNADILWYDRISTDERIYHEICKGVQIV